MGVMSVNDFTIGIALGLLGFAVLSGLLLLAFLLGTRQNKPEPKQVSAPVPQKRRIPTSSTTIPKGGIAQTQFPVSSFPHDTSDTD